MSAFSLATLVVVVVIPSAALVDAPYMLWGRSKLRGYLLEGVTDLVFVAAAFSMTRLWELGPFQTAGFLSVVIFLLKMAWVVITCVSGEEVKQPESLLGELWLWGVTVAGMLLLAFEIVSPFLMLTSVGSGR